MPRVSDERVGPDLSRCRPIRRAPLCRPQVTRTQSYRRACATAFPTGGSLLWRHHAATIRTRPRPSRRGGGEPRRLDERTLRSAHSRRVEVAHAPVRSTAQVRGRRSQVSRLLRSGTSSFLRTPNKSPKQRVRKFARVTCGVHRVRTAPTPPRRQPHTPGPAPGLSRTYRPTQFCRRRTWIRAHFLHRRSNHVGDHFAVGAVALAGLEGLLHAPVFTGMK